MGSKPKPIETGTLKVSVYTVAKVKQPDGTEKEQPQPQWGATVKVYRASKPDKAREEQTNPEGSIQFAVPVADNYTVEVTYQEHWPEKRENLPVYKGATTETNVYLYPRPRIEGKVTVKDTEGNVLPDMIRQVIYKVDKESGTLVAGPAYVHEDGTYQSDPLEAGTYTVTVKLEPVEESKSVTIADHQRDPAVVNFDLTFTGGEQQNQP